MYAHTDIILNFPLSSSDLEDQDTCPVLVSVLHYGLWLIGREEKYSALQSALQHCYYTQTGGRGDLVQLFSVVITTIEMRTRHHHIRDVVMISWQNVKFQSLVNDQLVSWQLSASHYLQSLFVSIWIGPVSSQSVLSSVLIIDSFLSDKRIVYIRQDL